MGSKKEERKQMSEAGDNNQPSKQKASYLAIWSLALSICGAFCFLVFITGLVIIGNLDDYVLILQFPSCALASLLGIAALVQRSRRYRRLWWLAIVGISISAISIILVVIWIVYVFFWIFPM